MMKKIATIILSLTTGCCFASGLYNVKEFGASGSKEVNATIPIQKAIDACAKNKGGVVFFPAGDYLCATIVLQDNVTLYLSSGATLWASNKESDYTHFFSFADTGGGGVPMLVYALHAKNISIKGEGVIRGQPEYYTEPMRYTQFIAEDCDAAIEAGVEMVASRWKKPNVSLVFLSECTHVTIEGISLINSPFWTLHLHWCDRVFVRGIFISSPLAVATNSDGIDIDGCTNIVVSDCLFETADDAICLKSTNSAQGFRDCRNIVVTNCIIKTSSCALKLGTESHGNFTDVLFSNCVVTESNRGLGIFIRDGGSAKNITFSNIQIDCIRYPVGWWGSGDAFRFVVLKRHQDSKEGFIENLTLKDIRATCQGSNRITGFSGNHTIQGVTIENVSLHISPEPTVDKRTKEGMSVANASNIKVNGLTIQWSGKKEKKWTHSLIFDNIKTLHTNNIDIINQPEGYEKIIITE